MFIAFLNRTGIRPLSNVTDAVNDYSNIQLSGH